MIISEDLYKLIGATFGINRRFPVLERIENLLIGKGKKRYLRTSLSDIDRLKAFTKNLELNTELDEIKEMFLEQTSFNDEVPKYKVNPVMLERRVKIKEEKETKKIELNLYRQQVKEKYLKEIQDTKEQIRIEKTLSLLREMDLIDNNCEDLSEAENELFFQLLAEESDLDIMEIDFQAKLRYQKQIRQPNLGYAPFHYEKKPLLFKQHGRWMSRLDLSWVDYRKF